MFSTCNSLLARRLEHVRVLRQQAKIYQPRTQDQRLPAPQGNVYFDLASRIDTQPDFVRYDGCSDEG
jgi:hypothetical protein